MRETSGGKENRADAFTIGVIPIEPHMQYLFARTS